MAKGKKTKKDEKMFIDASFEETFNILVGNTKSNHMKQHKVPIEEVMRIISSLPNAANYTSGGNFICKINLPTGEYNLLFEKDATKTKWNLVFETSD